MKKSLCGLLLIACLFVFYTPLVLAENSEKEFSNDENSALDKKEDATVKAYRNMAVGLKSITYDKLPVPIKKNFDSVFMDAYAPIVSHFKENVVFESLDFKRIPELAVPGEQEHAFLIIANLVIYNQSVRAILREMNFATGKPSYSLTLEFTEGIQLSNLAQELSIIDITINKLQMIFSDWKYEDKELGDITIEKGFNFLGEVQMVGALKPVNLLTKLEVLRMFGTIKKDLVGTTIKGPIPGELSLGGGTKLTKMMLGIDITGKLPLNTPVPQFMVSGDLKVKIKGLNDPINFTSILQIAAEKATLSGRMDGMWKDPFGLKGLSIGDVGLGASVLYTGAVPEGFAIKGVIELGDKKFSLATKGSVTEGAAFVGKMEGSLSYKDIVNFANNSTGAGLPVDQIFKIIPNVGIENPALQIVPIATTIVGKAYPQGTSFEGLINVFGIKTALKAHVLKGGIKGSAKLPEINIPGLFSISGLKNKAGVVEPPKLALNITKSGSKKAEFSAKGFIKLAPAILGGISSEGLVDFTTSGVNITMQSKLLDKFIITIDLKSKISLSRSLTGETIDISIAFDNSLFSYLAEQVDGGLKTVGKELTGALKVAAETVNESNKAIALLDREIASLKNDIKDLYNKSLIGAGAKLAEEGVKEIGKAAVAVGKGVAKLEGSIKAAGSTIHDLGKEINKLGNEIKKLLDDVGRGVGDLFKGKDPVKEARKRADKKRQEKRDKEAAQRAETVRQKKLVEKRKKQQADQNLLRLVEKKIKTLQTEKVPLGMRAQELLELVRQNRASIKILDDELVAFKEELAVPKEKKTKNPFQKSFKVFSNDRIALARFNTQQQPKRNALDASLGDIVRTLNIEIDRIIKDELPLQRLLNKLGALNAAGNVFSEKTQEMIGALPEKMKIVLMMKSKQEELAKSQAKGAQGQSIDMQTELKNLNLQLDVAQKDLNKFVAALEKELI